MRRLFVLSAAVIIAACAAPDDDVVDATDSVMADTDAPAAAPTTQPDSVSLTTILDNQPEAVRARYEFRNPAETLAFFGIEPGMAVGEALPGGGWYTKILLPYLGDEGRLVGVDYSLELWPNFGFASEEFVENKKSWPETWVADAREWTDADVDIDAYTFATLPADQSLDAFLFIRALHNLNRFEDGRFMTEALQSVHGALKPGGMVGVVQHEAPADADADWANGTNGYLKRADVVAAFEAAGFELAGSSDVNANPADMPTSDDSVWRLKPSRRSEEGNEALRAQLDAIGESNRMTLLFRKR